MCAASSFDIWDRLGVFSTPSRLHSSPKLPALYLSHTAFHTSTGTAVALDMTGAEAD